MTNIPMAQGDLYLLLPLAWQHYLDHLEWFSDYSEAYTTQTAADGLELLRLAQEMPDDQARGAGAEMTRRQLVPQLTEYLDAWLRLEGYIEKAFGDEGYKAMREAAGGDHYDAAAAQDWTAVTRLITSARRFVTENVDALTEGKKMPGTFPARLESEAQDVEQLLKKFLKQKSAAERGTTVKNDANLAALAAWQVVARDADRIFRRQPGQLKYFQLEHLLDLVRGTGQAGLRGTLTLPDGTVAEGVTVEVVGVKDAAATTDDDGRYALAVPAGTYTLRFSGEGFATKEVAGVEVQAGVKKRVDGKVEKAI